MNKFQVSQKIFSSPALQKLIKNQKKLDYIGFRIANPGIFSVQIQNSLENLDFRKFQITENFLESSICFQDSAIKFFEKIKTVEKYQKKTLSEIFEELKDKNLNEFPEEVQEDYFNLNEFCKNFWIENKENILGIFAATDTTLDSIKNNDFSNIFTIIVFLYHFINFFIRKF